MLRQSHQYNDQSRRRNSLKGFTAIVTGAGRGTGQATALALARSGANVACVARTSSELENVVTTISSSYQVIAIAIVADVSEASAAEAIRGSVLERIGPVDILINNAGINRINSTEHEDNFLSWWRVIEVNLRGPVALVHAILPDMLSRGRGTIISIGSRNAAVNFSFMTAYSASKTALLRFHQCLELELKGRGVHNYFVQPGDVATDLTRSEDAINFETVEKVPELREMLEATVGRSRTPPGTCCRHLRSASYGRGRKGSEWTLCRRGTGY